MKVWLRISLLLGIIGIVLCVVGVIGINNYSLSVNKMEQGFTKDINGSDIYELDIDVNAGNIKVVVADSFKVEVNTSNVKVEETGGVLSIEEKSKLNIFNKKNQEIILYVPENYTFDDVNVELGAGKIEIDKLDITNTFYLELGAGTCNFNDVKSDSAKIECGAGEIKGNINANDIDLSCGAGNVLLTALGTKDSFGYDLDVGIGKLKVGDISINGIGNEKIENLDTDNMIKVDCGAGNVNIDFSEE